MHGIVDRWMKLLAIVVRVMSSLSFTQGEKTIIINFSSERNMGLLSSEQCSIDKSYFNTLPTLTFSNIILFWLEMNIKSNITLEVVVTAEHARPNEYNVKTEFRWRSSFSLSLSLALSSVDVNGERRLNTRTFLTFITYQWTLSRPTIVGWLETWCCLYSEVLFAWMSNKLVLCLLLSFCLSCSPTTTETTTSSL